MTLRAADLFCGAGGTSCGAESTGAARVMFALNHWETAVETHSRNFPHAVHVNSRLDQTSPSECGKIDLLFASPECTHHSRARGGRPTSDQQRAGAWDVLKWVEFHRPSWLVVENVVEFEAWGPVGEKGVPLVSRKGAFFHAWIAAIEAAGYRVEWRQMNAADFGAATSRNRLFVIARKGSRRPVFPEPTHLRRSGGELPGMHLPKWRAASEVIDWSIPCPSIFSRKRPLAPKTLARIEAGLRRFVGPFVASWTNTSTGSCEYDPAKPMPTVLTKAHMGLTVPFLSHFYGNGDSSPVTTPVDTITTRDRHALVVAQLLQTMAELQVIDIGFRMLQNHELSAAQGFPASYVFCGSKSAVTRQIGNSVAPPVAAAITRAIAGVA